MPASCNPQVVLGRVLFNPRRSPFLVRARLRLKDRFEKARSPFLPRAQRGSSTRYENVPSFFLCRSVVAGALRWTSSWVLCLFGVDARALVHRLPKFPLGGLCFLVVADVCLFVLIILWRNLEVEISFLDFDNPGLPQSSRARCRRATPAAPRARRPTVRGQGYQRRLGTEGAQRTMKVH